MKPWSIAIALLVTSQLLLVGPVKASASLRPVECSNFGSRQAVLLVHGFNSSGRTWSEETKQYLGSNANNTCIATFDYQLASTNWVTDSQIGPALAIRIKSLANASRKGAGSGKVIVIAHSMGGLATRCAASERCSGQADVGQAIAAVVTLGTPNLGTFVKGYGRSLAADILGPLLSARCTAGNVLLRVLPCDSIRALGTSAASKAFTPGSGQLRELPTFAESGRFPVLALAGSVRFESSFWGRSGKVIVDGGDLLVGEDSALVGARRIRGIGGEHVVDCGYLELTSIQPRGAFKCWHGTQTNKQEFLVQALSVITKINKENLEPTQIVRLNPLDASGRIRPDYQVEDVTNVDPLDCEFGDSSPNALTDSTHFCGGTADSANACFESPAYPGNLICHGFAWERKVFIQRAINVGETSAPRDPQPLGVELEDGSRWWYRIGGAWGGRSDGAAGAYGCGASCPNGSGDVVLLVNRNYPAIERNGPVWYARRGELGEPDEEFPPPSRVPIRRAWFISSE